MLDVMLQERFASLIREMGYQFVGCEWNREGHGPVLRIYIDKESGVTLDDCSRVSRQISAMLDIEDPISEQYTLEVSSPGPKRSLFESKVM